MTYNENMKKSIYKWRENNKEKYNSYQVVSGKEKNRRERHNKNENQTYHYKRECLRMRNILIDI